MSKWTDETIEKAIRDFMSELQVDRMPTNTEMRLQGKSGLSRAITLTGGMYTWSEKLGIPIKKPTLKWNSKKIHEELIKSVKVLQIDRMPTASELTKIGRNDLHCAISKSKKKYRGWAEEIGLELKESETFKGNKWETYVAEVIRGMGFKVEQMTTKHPYDLLVNGAVKIDVKVGTSHKHFGTRCHTFATNKKYATCDLYICIGLDEEENIEKQFVIPSKFAQLVTLNICNDSKYNAFLDKWEYVKRFVEFYTSVEVTP